MPSSDFERIKPFLVEFCSNLTPSHILPILLQNGVITPRDVEQVERKEQNEGASSAAQYLLHNILTKRTQWHDHLIRAMYTEGLKDLARKVDPVLTDKLDSEENMAGSKEALIPCRGESPLHPADCGNGESPGSPTDSGIAQSPTSVFNIFNSQNVQIGNNPHVGATSRQDNVDTMSYQSDEVEYEVTDAEDEEGSTDNENVQLSAPVEETGAAANLEIESQNNSYPNDSFFPVHVPPLQGYNDIQRNMDSVQYEKRFVKVMDCPATSATQRIDEPMDVNISHVSGNNNDQLPNEVMQELRSASNDELEEEARKRDETNPKARYYAASEVHLPNNLNMDYDPTETSAGSEGDHGKQTLPKATQDVEFDDDSEENEQQETEMIPKNLEQDATARSRETSWMSALWTALTNIE